jgi:hypothetical protein
MAKYDTPQPIWKRNLAGILDFVFFTYPAAVLLSKLPGNPPPRAPYMTPNGLVMTELRLSLTYALVLVALTIAYFVLMNRTGGTIFQRLFRMKPVRPRDVTPAQMS